MKQKLTLASISFVFFFISAQSCDDNIANSENHDLCHIDSSNKNDDDPCVGDFIVSLNQIEGTIKHSDDFGYYLQFSVEGTYDCTFIGKICNNEDYTDIIDSKVLFSADIHEYSANYNPPVGGQKIISVFNLKLI